MRQLNANYRPIYLEYNIKLVELYDDIYKEYLAEKIEDLILFLIFIFYLDDVFYNIIFDKIFHICKI